MTMRKKAAEKSASDSISTAITMIMRSMTGLFVTLRACDLIDWGFWWVISPVWISLGISVLILAASTAIDHFNSDGWTP